MKAGYITVTDNSSGKMSSHVFIDVRGTRTDVFCVVLSSDKWVPLARLYGTIYERLVGRRIVYVARFTFRGLFRLLYANSAFAQDLLCVTRHTPEQDVDIFYRYPFLRKYLAPVDLTSITVL